ERPEVGVRLVRDYADLPPSDARITPPPLPAPCQCGRPITRIVLGMHLIATPQQEVDVIDTTRTSIHSDDGPRALGRGEGEGVFGGLNQRRQGRDQLDRAGKQSIDDHFVVETGHNPAQVSTAPIALLGEVAFASKRRLRTTGHTAHISIQELPALLVVMTIALAVPAIDVAERLFHLVDILSRASIQGIL